MLSRKLLRKLTPEVIQQALAERSRLSKMERMAVRRRKLIEALGIVDAEMRKLEGNGSPSTAQKTGRRKGYKLSAVTRNRMRVAALKRYGKLKDDAPTPKKGKRVFSLEARQKMADAARARWAAARAAKGSTEPKAKAKA